MPAPVIVFMAKAAVQGAISAAISAVVDETEYQMRKDVQKRERRQIARHPFKMIVMGGLKREIQRRIVVRAVKAFPEAFVEAMVIGGVTRGVRVRRINARAGQRAAGARRPASPFRSSIASRNRRTEQLVGKGFFLGKALAAESSLEEIVHGSVESVAGSTLWARRIK